jgi:hypothetical protein
MQTLASGATVRGALANFRFGRVGGHFTAATISGRDLVSGGGCGAFAVCWPRGICRRAVAAAPSHKRESGFDFVGSKLPSVFQKLIFSGCVYL